MAGCYDSEGLWHDECEDNERIFNIFNDATIDVIDDNINKRPVDEVTTFGAFGDYLGRHLDDAFEEYKTQLILGGVIVGLLILR